MKLIEIENEVRLHAQKSTKLRWRPLEFEKLLRYLTNVVGYIETD